MIKNFTLNLMGMPVEEAFWSTACLSPSQDQIFQAEAIQDRDGNWVHWGFYEQCRQGDYPTPNQQLDLIVKCLSYLRANGTTLGTDGDNLVDTIEAINTKYPNLGS